MTRRRVVITGVGCVTPLGSSVPQVWEHLTAGRSGVAPITAFDASSFPVRIAAEVRDWSLAEVGLTAADWQHHARQTRFAIGAALRAMAEAGLVAGEGDPRRRGVYLGCGEIFPDFDTFTGGVSAAVQGAGFAVESFVDRYADHVDPRSEETLEPGVAVGLIAGLLDLQGPSLNFTNACVSSATAIGEATEVIRRGDADVMIAGGAHSMIHPLGISGFHRLSTLSLRNDDPAAASRPFDRDRDGFVAGEGGAVVILEELEHARQRGADIWAELMGYGSSHDAFRITDPRPSGRGAVSCMAQALCDAGIQPENIDYINAHGSGTVVNDRVETEAIKIQFGRRAYQIPISSTKSMTGHLTTACGGLEVLVCALAVRHGVVPPTINYETPDPNCDLDYVANASRTIRCRYALNNNFGFGGQNVGIVLGRFGG